MLPQIFNKQKQTKKYRQPHPPRITTIFSSQQQLYHQTKTLQIQISISSHRHTFSQNPYNQVKRSYFVTQYNTHNKTYIMTHGFHL